MNKPQSRSRSRSDQVSLQYCRRVLARRFFTYLEKSRRDTQKEKAKTDHLLEKYCMKCDVPLLLVEKSSNAA